MFGFKHLNNNEFIIMLLRDMDCKKQLKVMFDNILPYNNIILQFLHILGEGMDSFP